MKQYPGKILVTCDNLDFVSFSEEFKKKELVLNYILIDCENAFKASLRLWALLSLFSVG